MISRKGRFVQAARILVQGPVASHSWIVKLPSLVVLRSAGNDRMRLRMLSFQWIICSVRLASQANCRSGRLGKDRASLDLKAIARLG
jgi:hypothetical protein